MIEVEEIDGGLRVVDAAKNEVEIEIEDWVPGGEPLEIDRDVDGIVTGRAKLIRTSRHLVVIESTEQNGLIQLAIDGTRDFSHGSYLIQIGGPIDSFVRIECGFRIDSDITNDTVTLTLDGSPQTTLGFRSLGDFPGFTLTVPRTSRGLASAISKFGEVHRTDSPDRSYPSMRRHPPLVEFDEELSADDLLERSSEATIKIILNDSLESVFLATSLAYYLDAKIDVETGGSPAIETSEVCHEFANLDTLHREFSALLQRVFYLDCLVRNVGPYGMDIEELSLLGHLPFDPHEAYDLAPDERLAEYLATPFEEFSDSFPDWPLTISIDPTWDHAPALPYIAHRLGLVVPPTPRAIDKRSFIQQSISARIRSESANSSVLSLDGANIIDPGESTGQMQGWMAEGIAVNAFNTTSAAFANRARFLSTSRPLSILVVLNDRTMSSEFSSVQETYSERIDLSESDVRIYEDISSGLLAEMLEEPFDFLHFIGHCDSEGILCSDGYLSPRELSICNVQTFFLNACRSYQIGRELVQMGSVAGAVTVSDVLDAQAMKVGSTFAWLICSGHSIERSLWMSRVQAILNRQYTVVGDGTHTLVASESTIPTIMQASKEDADRYQIRLISSSPDHHGGIFQTQTRPKPVLGGNENEHVISDERFEGLLSTSKQPCIYNDKFYWPDELLDELF